MAAPVPVNNAFTPAQLNIIRSIPGSAESLAAIDGADGYDAVFDNLVAAIDRANVNPVDYTAVTGRLSMLNRRLTQRLERIQARFVYYASVEGLSLQLLEKLANAKLLFNLAMGRLNRGVIGEPEFNAVVDRLEGFVAELDAVVPPPDGGYPEPPPDGAAPGGGPGGNPGGGPGGNPGGGPGGGPGGNPGGNGGGGGGNPGNGGLHVLPPVPDHPLANPLEAGGAANPLRVDPGGGGPPPRRRNALLGSLDGLGVNRQGAVAALRDNYERPEEPLEQSERRGGEMRDLRARSGYDYDSDGGRKRKSKRASKRKMKKTKTKKSRKVTRKQRGGFRYVTKPKPKTKRHSSSSSSSSTSSTMSSARN